MCLCVSQRSRNRIVQAYRVKPNDTGVQFGININITQTHTHTHTRANFQSDSRDEFIEILLDGKQTGSNKYADKDSIQTRYI